MEKNKKRVIANMSWLMGGKIVNMILSFFVSLATARYLGPSNFGSINYVAAYVSFFSSIASLGLSVIVIKEVSSGEEDDNKVIWTGILMRFLTAVVSTVAVVAFFAIAKKNDPLLVPIAALESIAILASAFDTFMYWFQGKLLGKFVSIAGVIAYLAMSLYRLYLLANGADILWFAFATSVDTLVLALVLFIFYVKENGFRPVISLPLGKKLLKQSYHYLISGLIAILYSKIDQIMLGDMLDKASVGLYSAALTIAGLWGMIPSAFIQSVSPILYKNAQTDRGMFLKRLKQSYAGIWFLNVCWSLAISLFSYWVVLLLYGAEYMGARKALIIVVWYSGISSLGSLTQVYLATENKNKYINYFALAGLVTDVVLNALLIPHFGIMGAAVATLATYCVIHIVMPLVIKDTREAAVLILQGMIFRDVIDENMKQYGKMIVKKVFRRK
ncbi:MAG: flippase [Agathobacter sp.]|nr:flippase [Agathobacter sp.]